jgi:hypothetical protein
MAMGTICRVSSIQRRLPSIVPDKLATPNLHSGGVSNFAHCLPKLKRAMRFGNNRAHRGGPPSEGDCLADRGCLAFDVCLKRFAA